MTQPTPETTQPAQAAGTPQQTQPAQSGKRWREGEFDEERATRLIANLERDLADARDKANKFDEAEKSKLGEVDRLNGDLKTAQDTVAKLTRENAQIVAGVNAGLTIAQSKRLSGEKLEDFEADAKAFAEELGIKTPGDPATNPAAEVEEPSSDTGKDISNHRGSKSTAPATAAPTQRPVDTTPAGGRAPEVEPEEDMAAIVAAIPRT